jgi:hypothetical protein
MTPYGAFSFGAVVCDTTNPPRHYPVGPYAAKRCVYRLWAASRKKAAMVVDKGVLLAASKAQNARRNCQGVPQGRCPGHVPARRKGWRRCVIRGTHSHPRFFLSFPLIAVIPAPHCHSRESGNPHSQIRTPASAGVTGIKGFASPSCSYPTPRGVYPERSRMGSG